MVCTQASPSFSPKWQVGIQMPCSLPNSPRNAEAEYERVPRPRTGLPTIVTRPWSRFSFHNSLFPPTQLMTTFESDPQTLGQEKEKGLNTKKARNYLSYAVSSYICTLVSSTPRLFPPTYVRVRLYFSRIYILLRSSAAHQMWNYSSCPGIEC